MTGGRGRRMSDTEKDWRWLPYAIGALVTVIVCTVLVTIIMETTGSLWVVIAITLSGVGLTTVLVFKVDKILSDFFL